MAPQALIVVLSLASDEQTARQAVQRGASDYLVKGHVDGHWLPRALRYLIERPATHDELRSSEARFRAMSDASPLGIYVSDAQGGCIYTNAAYHKISGLSFDETLGTRWSRAIHPDDRQRVLAEWGEAVRGLAPFQTEFRFLQYDQSIVWTRVNSGAMSDGMAPHGRVETVEDITERKTAEFVLQAAEDRLFEERERAQGLRVAKSDGFFTMLRMYIDWGCMSAHSVLDKMAAWTTWVRFAYHVAIMEFEQPLSVRLPAECEGPLLERFLKAEAMALWTVRSARLHNVPANVYSFLRKHEEDEQKHLAQFESLIGRQPLNVIVFPLSRDNGQR